MFIIEKFCFVSGFFELAALIGLQIGSINGYFSKIIDVLEIM